MRDRTVVVARALLVMLVVVIAGLTLAGCAKRKADESPKQSAATEDRQTATGAGRPATEDAAQPVTDAGLPPPAVPATPPAGGKEKPATPAPADTGSTPLPAGGKQPPAVNEPPAADQASETADDAGKAAAPPGEVGDFQYVGVAACSMCHKGAAKGSIYEIWLASPHARAFENLDAESRKNEVCLACHTTGHGKPLAANVTPGKMVNVQCEACHGPGSDYKSLAVMKNRAEALGKGLVLPSRERCLGCHEGKFPAGHPPAAFDYESALLKIEHHSKPIEPAK